MQCQNTYKDCIQVENCKNFNVINIEEEFPLGYILEVDLEYPSIMKREYNLKNIKEFIGLTVKINSVNNGGIDTEINKLKVFIFK